LQINKSDLLKQFSDNFPNFIKKDLLKIIDIILDEIASSMRKGERVELRDVFMFETKIYKKRSARNPKTNEKIFVPEKKNIRFKLSKKWQNKINEKT
tara:strand:- start:1392 stop:1682 length:291 start_codon:yes stop_codon:yes gene_type:complete